MDETTIARLSELVKGMHDQGMSVKQIEENLEQMGISREDIKVIVTRAGLKPSTVDIHEEVTAVKEAISTGEAVKPVVEKLGEAEEHFERLHAKMDMLHEKHKEVSQAVSELSELRAELSEIKNLLLEIRAAVAATKKLQEDLIEINRRVLARESVK